MTDGQGSILSSWDFWDETLDVQSIPGMQVAYEIRLCHPDFEPNNRRIGKSKVGWVERSEREDEKAV